MNYPCRNFVKLAWSEAHISPISKLDLQHSFNDHEDLVRIRMKVPIKDAVFIDCKTNAMVIHFLNEAIAVLLLGLFDQ